jgi:hypothetical protein
MPIFPGGMGELKTGSGSNSDGSSGGGTSGSNIDPSSRVAVPWSGNNIYTFLLQQFPYMMQLYGLPYEFVGGPILRTLSFVGSGVDGPLLEWTDTGARLYSSASYELTVENSLVITGTLSHAGSYLGFYGKTPVEAKAYTYTNVVESRDIDADSVTLNSLADIVGTLISDLKSVGLLG